MGGLAMVAIWILVRLLFEGKNENGSLTSLNLSNVESDLESGNSSYEAVARPEPSVDTSFDEFFETYYKNRWSTNDILSFLRIFLTTTCYFRLSPGNRSLARKRAAAADGVVAIPGSEPRTIPLLNRPGTYAAAFIGVFLFAFGDLSFAALDDLARSSFWMTTISGIVSLLLAVAIGALRQLYNGLLERAVAVPTDRGLFYVGIIPPKFWLDVRVQAASWLLVAALSVWASWGLACGVFRSHSREEFLLWANLVLLVRFGISVGLTRAYFAFRHSRQEKR
ncbi:MAG: hypothetical protein DMG17_32370 [Acidobacteria bacterium]|nr:MAG: hypothetical protein DMG17_32370 [Acidobacteriota bacterium]